MKKSCSFFIYCLLICTLSACNQQTTNKETTETTTKPTSDDNNEIVEERLRRFDSLDFQFYSHQQFDSFAISHADNIKVYYPDGTVTEGLFPQHIDMLKPMFVFAPDTKVTTHPVKFGCGEWTAVIGEVEGTFSQPMPIGNGKTIPPTGKKFKFRMSTIGRWQNGKMTEEHLFWDNQSILKQIGVAP